MAEVALRGRRTPVVVMAGPQNMQILIHLKVLSIKLYVLRTCACVRVFACVFVYTCMCVHVYTCTRAICVYLYVRMMCD